MGKDENYNAETGTEVVSFEQATSIFDCLIKGEANFFTSLKAETEEEKAALFNACSAPALRIKDNIGKQLEICDILCHPVTLENEQGEMNVAGRIVLIATDGQAYVSVSRGMMSALEKVIGIYGNAPWNPAIIIEPILIQSGKLNSVLSIKLHPRKSPHSK